MGIYDRDYYQGPERGGYLDSGGGGQMMVTKLVIINALVYLVMIIFDAGNDPNPASQYIFTKKHLALNSGIFFTNWQLWQLVTYGFVHSWDSLFHILGNMFCLWFFGRDVEGVYGKKRFLAFYLSTIVISGLLGLYSQQLITGRPVSLVGASGGVAGVIALYIFHFPQRTLLLYFVLPVRAWVLGVIFLIYDFFGTFQNDHVAHTAHLVGGACGWLYFKTGWDASRLLPNAETLKRFQRRPDVRIHNPDADDLTEEVDQILAKINRDGESSLTKKERRTLEKASRRYKKKQE